MLNILELFEFQLLTNLIECFASCFRILYFIWFLFELRHFNDVLIYFKNSYLLKFLLQIGAVQYSELRFYIASVCDLFTNRRTCWPHNERKTVNTALGFASSNIKTSRWPVRASICKQNTHISLQPFNSIKLAAQYFTTSFYNFDKLLCCKWGIASTTIYICRTFPG